MFEKEHQSTKKHLGMIIKKNQDDFWGNFYYVGDARGTQAALIVTLANKDPKGMKAASLGKKCRKQISGAKFCQGVVRMNGSKLLFEVVSGSATPKVMTNGFKGCLNQSAELKFLKVKAKVRMFRAPEETEAENEEDNAAEAEISNPAQDALDAEEFDQFLEGIEFNDDDLADLQTLGPRMDELERQMSAIYGATPPLSEEELIAQEEQRLQELIEQSLSESAEINQLCEDLQQQLENLDPATDPETERALREELARKTEELQEARYDLAANLYTGEQPFPPPVSELSPEIKTIMSAALTDSVSAIHNRLAEIREQTQILHAEVTANSGNREWLQTEAIRILQQSAQKELAANSLLDEITQLTST